MKSLIHSAFSLFLVLFAAQALAQRPLAITVEAGLHSGFLDAANQARIGLQWGVHEWGLEYGASYSESPTQHFGLRYRAFLPASPSLSGVLPFVQAGASLSDIPRFQWGTPLRSFNVDLATGLKVALWKGLHLSGHVGLRYNLVHTNTEQFIYYAYNPRIRPVGGVALGYTLPLRPSVEPGGEDLPQLSTRPNRHEVGLSFSNASIGRWFSYSDFRLHYAYRLRPHWDLRAAIDLPAWPIYYAATQSVSDHWEPGLSVGARFWANPSPRFALFADASLLGVRHYLPAISDFASNDIRLQPEVGAGVRARITPALGVELHTFLRTLPQRGFRTGISDNGVRLGLSYRFGAGKQLPSPIPD